MSRLKVLVVDDEPALLKLLQVALESEGHTVLLASDGQTALTRINEEHPDLVLLDVMMPVIDGWGVLERARQVPRRPRIVCLTAKDSQRDRIKGWRLGADEYISKPFDVDSLMRTIQEVVRRSPSEQAERRRQALSELTANGSGQRS